MALEYRTPLSLFQASLSKDLADNLMSVKYNEVLKIEEETQGLFSYHMSPEKSAYLFERGVYLSPNSVSPHPHPLCKTLENHFLHRLLPLYIDKTKSIMFFSCKLSKVNMFTLRTKIDVALINRIIDAKDASRYAGTHLIERKKPLAYLMDSYTQVFFHDELHHWSFKEFRMMISNFKGSRLNIFATVVYPVECTKGYMESMNPLCYQFRVHGDNIYFFPDGNASGMYVQKRKTWIFGTSHIYDEQGRVWTITKLDSLAAHHLFMISLGDFESPDRMIYQDFTLIPMSRFIKKVNYPMLRVRSTIMKNVMIYLMSLKKADINSAVAKVRQLCGKEIYQDEAIFAASLAKNITSCSFVSSLGDKFGLEALLDTLFNFCPPCLQRLFDKKKFLSREFLMDFNFLEPLELTIKRSRQLHDFLDPNFEFEDLTNVLYQGDMERLMDERWMFKEVINLCREPREYSLNYMSHKFEKEECRAISAIYKQRRLIEAVEKGWAARKVPGKPLLLTCSEALINEKGTKAGVKDVPGKVYRAEERGCEEATGRVTETLSSKTSIKKDGGSCDPPLQHGKYDLVEPRESGNPKRFIEEGAVGVPITVEDKPGIGIEGPTGIRNAEHPETSLRGSEKHPDPLIKDRGLDCECGDTETEAIHLDRLGQPGVVRGAKLNEHKDLEFRLAGDKGEQRVDDGEILSAGLSNKSWDEGLDKEGMLQLAIPTSKREKDKGLDRVTEQNSTLSNHTQSHETDNRISFTICPHEHEKMNVPADGDCFYYAMKELEGFQGDVADYKHEVLNGLLVNHIITAEEHEFYMAPGRWADECVTHNALSRSKMEIKVHEDLGNSCYVVGPRGKQKARCLLLQREHFSPLKCLEISECVESASDEVENPHRFDMTKVTEIINRGLQNACIINALSKRMHVRTDLLLTSLIGKDPFWGEWILKEEGGTVDDLMKILNDLGQPAFVHTENGILAHECGTERRRIHLFMFRGHCSDEPPEDYKVAGFRLTSDDVGSMVSALPLHSEVELCFELDRAKKLRDSFLNSYTGIDSSSFRRDIRIIKNEGELHKKVHSFLGFAGSGKSRGIMNLVNGVLNRRDVIVIVPRVNLRKEWVKKAEESVNKLRFGCFTFETALRHLRDRNIIIVDEITLFPPGYLDLLMYIANFENLIILGDPLQKVYYSKNDNYYLKQSNDIEKFAGKMFRYAMYSHRLPRDSPFDILTYGRREVLPCSGKIYKEVAAMYKEVKGMGENYHIISLSREMAVTMQSHCEKGHSMTIGESQGLTFNFVVIVIDVDAKLADPRTWMVALTRALGGFCFLLMDGVTQKNIEDNLRGSIMYKVMKGIKVSKEHLIYSCGEIMKKAEIVESEEKFCTGQADIEDKLQGDPYLKGLLNIIEFPWPAEVELKEPGRHDSPPKTHLLLSPGVTYLEIDERMRAREHREFRISGRGWSHQFNDLDDKPRPNRLNPWCSMFQSIYPKHESIDDLTFWAAVKKRLLFACPERNARELETTKVEGRVLFERLVEVYGLKGRSTCDVAERVMEEFREKRLSKSAKLIESHSERSDPNWAVDYFRLFMKTQLCSKFEKRFVEAKAGQTLACFSHLVLLRFGEKCRQLENDLRSDLPGNIYIHSQKNFDDLNEFTKKYFREREGTDSDFEAFDRSQDATILNLEILLLEHYGWERDLIEDYKFLKMTMGCKLGSMAIMRFTGEFGTFLFNTVANMAFTSLRYEVKRDTVLLFAGDDMCSPGRLKVIHDYDHVLSKLNLKAKVNVSNEPIFCGWRLSPYGIYKEPRLILDRWLIAEEKGVLDDCLINYSMEAIYAYELGDKLYDLIKEIEPFQELVRKIVKRKHKLPLRIRQHFESYGDDFSEHGEVFEEVGRGEHDHGGCGSLCCL